MKSLITLAFLYLNLLAISQNNYIRLKDGVEYKHIISVTNSANQYTIVTKNGNVYTVAKSEIASIQLDDTISKSQSMPINSYIAHKLDSGRTEEYCLIIATGKLFSTKVTIHVDFGQETQ